MALELLMLFDRRSNALVPADSGEAQAIAELEHSPGVLKVRVTQSRTNKFHRKGMGLFRFLFNLWEPADMVAAGIPVKKDFDSFRENLTIQAGFFRQVFRVDGGFEIKAESLAWGSMDQTRFSAVFNAVIDVGLRLLPNMATMSREQVDAGVEELLRFDQ